MTNPVATVAESDAQVRWQNWLARGAGGDRRRARRIRQWTLFAMAALLVWFFVRLA